MRDECIGIPPRFSCELCPSRFRRKYHMVRHLTSKHSIPPTLAQQASGGGNRNANRIISSSSTTTTGTNELDGLTTGNEVNSSSMPENLSLRKENYEAGGVGAGCGSGLGGAASATGAGGVLGLNLLNCNNMAASPAHSGGACSSTGTHSPLPAHMNVMPTYGLSGAITAMSTTISAAVLAVEQEQLQKLQQLQQQQQDNENNAQINNNMNKDDMEIIVKNEPISPNKTTTNDNETTTSATNNTTTDISEVVGKMDDDWKMKFSMQLISNSLLKERLMNTIPFGTGYNNN